MSTMHGLSCVLIIATVVVGTAACRDGGESDKATPTITTASAAADPAAAGFGTGTILTESWVDDNPEIYAIDVETGEMERLTDDRAFDNAPDWSPDGTQIVFQSDRDGDWGVYVMNADGSDVTQLAENAGFPRWSPDGEHIVFVAGDDQPDIYVMDADGTGVTQITSDPAFDSFPDWSPDGTQIAFQSQRTGTNAVFVVNVDGTVPRQTLVGGAPTWSPDGTRIAFISSQDGNDDISIANADGTDITRLTTDDASDLFPDWSPDGAYLTFTSDRDGDFDIYLITVDGDQTRALTVNNVRDFGAGWATTSR